MTTTSSDSETTKFRDALVRLNEILNANEISTVPLPKMELFGDIVRVFHGSEIQSYALGNSDLRRPGSAKPYVLFEDAEKIFADAVSQFFNATMAVTLRRARLAEIAEIVADVLRSPAEDVEDLGDESPTDMSPDKARRSVKELRAMLAETRGFVDDCDEDEDNCDCSVHVLDRKIGMVMEETDPNEPPRIDLKAGTLEEQIIARLSITEDSEANAYTFYESSTADDLQELEQLLETMVGQKKIVRFYRVRTPFDHNDGIADYATLDEIPEEFEDDWRDPPTSFTREQAIIDVRYKLAR
jgi:hypothetical protein